jgi:glutaredoxin/glutathione-dependent peroxiredoxin
VPHRRAQLTRSDDLPTLSGSRFTPFEGMTMSIKEGEKLPQATMHLMKDGKPTPVSTDDLFQGKKVVMFAVPGAYTPTCSMAHLPGFVVNADKLKEKGVDSIVCVSVNDAFVMDSWGKDKNAEALLMVGDGNGEFTRKIGLEMDGSGFGLGTRSQRYAMIVEDGVVTKLAVEAPGKLEVSKAEAMLESL